MRFLKPIRRFLANTDGTTAVEYCVMLGLLVLSCIIGIMAAGSGVSGWWTNIHTELDTNGF
ncbi:MAG: Flp family type IVb pilin [Planctomycetaceae bacterium]